MAVTPNNALELREEQPDPSQLLVSMEITDQCRWTPVCTNCILGIVHSRAGKAMAKEEALSVGRALVSGPGASGVRHLFIAGKEPTESSEVLLGLVAAWNESPADQRCRRLGVISASVSGIRSLAPAMANLGGLSWLMTSADTEGTGLRDFGAVDGLLKAVSHAKKLGASRAFAVNSIATGSNCEGLLEIGRRAAAVGADQFSIGPLLLPENGQMKSACSKDELSRIVEMILSEPELADGVMQVTIDVDLQTMVAMVGGLHRLSGYPDQWRFEYVLSRNVKIVALNASSKHHFRIRWDGQILSNEDFFTVGVEQGSLGRATPARIAELLAEASFQPASR